MTEFATLRLLGGSHEARKSWSHAKHRHEWCATIEIDDPTALDWSDVPAVSGRAEIEGEPLTVTIQVGARWHYATSWDEIREVGADLVWAAKNPNAARVKQIRELLGYYRTVAAEAKQPGALVLTLSWDPKHGSWQASEEKDRYRIVYTYRPGYSGAPWLREGRPRLYRAERTIVDHPPTAGRQGFKLVALSDHGEYMDPDAEIARLEAAIAAGHP